MDVSGIYLQPITDALLVETLSSGRRWRLTSGESIQIEERLENYIVRGLIDKPDIDYSSHADLIYKLAGQVVGRLRSYIPDENDVVRVVVYHQRQLTDLVYAQMQRHQFVAPVDYEANVTKGFQTFHSNSFDVFERSSFWSQKGEIYLMIPTFSQRRMPRSGGVSMPISMRRRTTGNDGGTS